MIVRARPRDIDRITEGWSRSLARAGLAMPDRAKLKRLATECVSGPFAWASPGGALLARRTDRIVGHRKQATVVCWYSLAGGVGFGLLRTFLDAASRHKSVSQVAVHWELGWDARLLRVLGERYGLSPGWLLTRAARGSRSPS